MGRSSKSAKAIADIELDPNAWPKFEALVKSAAKIGPKQNAAKSSRAKRAKPRKRAPSA